LVCAKCEASWMGGPVAGRPGRPPDPRKWLRQPAAARAGRTDARILFSVEVAATRRTGAGSSGRTPAFTCPANRGGTAGIWAHGWFVWRWAARRCRGRFAEAWRFTAIIVAFPSGAGIFRAGKGACPRRSGRRWLLQRVRDRRSTPPTGAQAILSCAPAPGGEVGRGPVDGLDRRGGGQRIVCLRTWRCGGAQQPPKRVGAGRGHSVAT